MLPQQSNQDKGWLKGHTYLTIAICVILVVASGFIYHSIRQTPENSLSILSLNKPLNKKVNIGYGYDLVIKSEYPQLHPDDGTEGSIEVSGHGKTVPLVPLTDDNNSGKYLSFNHMGASGKNGFSGEGNIYFASGWFAVYMWYAGADAGSSSLEIYQNTPLGPVLKNTLGGVGSLQITPGTDTVTISGSAPEEGTTLTCQACVKQSAVTLRWRKNKLIYFSGSRNYLTYLNNGEALQSGITPDTMADEKTSAAQHIPVAFIISVLFLICFPFIGLGIRKSIKRFNPALHIRMQMMSPFRKIFIFVTVTAWFLIVLALVTGHQIIDEDLNTVVDSRGNTIRVSVGGPATSLVWINNNKWISADEPMSMTTAETLTPAKPDCLVSAKEGVLKSHSIPDSRNVSDSTFLSNRANVRVFWDTVNSDMCSIIVYNDCTHAYRFVNIVARLASRTDFRGTNVSDAVKGYTRGTVIRSCYGTYQ